MTVSDASVVDYHQKHQKQVKYYADAAHIVVFTLSYAKEAQLFLNRFIPITLLIHFLSFDGPITFFFAFSFYSYPSILVTQ